MPTIERNGASIYYEETGRGFPILTFAPAGLQSVIDVWRRPAAPINPLSEFANDFRVIAMDQRNAGGRSRAPITARDGWDTYAADHIAVLDHLKIDRCHLYGQCIGGSFIMGVDTALVKSLTFGVSAAYTGVAGALSAIVIAYVAPDSFNVFLSITFLIGIVIGGFASIWGNIFGAFFIQYVPNWAQDISKAAPWAVFGIFLIAFMYAMPYGIAGAIRLLWIRLYLSRVSKEPGGGVESSPAKAPTTT